LCHVGHGWYHRSMTKAEFITEMAGVLMVSPDELKPDTELAKFEAWDSTAVVNLLVLLDERLRGGDAEIGGGDARLGLAFLLHTGVADDAIDLELRELLVRAGRLNFVFRHTGRDAGDLHDGDCEDAKKTESFK